MSKWDLFKSLKGTHTADMRPPQSARRPVSLITISIVMIAVLAALPVRSEAATQQLVCSPPNLRFGGVPTGQTEAQFTILTNTGQTSATISAVTASDSEFSVSGLPLPLTLTAGESVAVRVQFAPTALGGSTGSITFTNDTESPTLNLPVVGTGFQSDPVDTTPASLSFGQVDVGQSSSLSVTLTNVRQWNKTVTGFYVVGTDFSVKGPSMPVVLAHGQSIQLEVTFSPRAAGAVAGSVFVNGPALSIPLSGTGATIGQLNVSPAGLNFGSVDVGATSVQSLSLSATAGTVTVSSASSTNSHFTIPGASFPLTVNAGTTVQVDVAFDPASTGTSTGTLTFASNATNGQSSESLTGVGITPEYSVSLSWVPSTSPVAGYNVYRGTSIGNYTRINSSLDASTAYTDSSVVSGTTYYYAATAVNSSGEESAYSTPLKVLIP